MAAAQAAATEVRACSLAAPCSRPVSRLLGGCLSQFCIPLKQCSSSPLLGPAFVACRHAMSASFAGAKWQAGSGDLHAQGAIYRAA